MGGALFMSLWKEKMIELANKATKTTTNTDDEEGIGNKITTQLSSVVCPRLASAVTASSVTGLIASLVFSSSVSGPVYCGSFIGMSSPQRIETYGGLVGASFMCGICQLVMSQTVFLGGWGGKLGTAALLGVLSHIWLMNTLQNRSRVLKQQEQQQSTSTSEEQSSSSSDIKSDK